MSRPRKYKRVYCVPNNNVFGSLNSINNDDFIIMLVEEFETIRLIDWEGLTQEECAQEMNVARATVQKLYQDARTKLANSLVNGLLLKVEGGNYELHENASRFYKGQGCRQQRFHHRGRRPFDGPGRGRHRFNK
ncbi:MAG: DUF134 domain-containing protein [Erysipelotrichia bacterium]|jgi:predicted DNA-binding protein (UPF0251 family)|nr:DUF134 domain-containing protein [Erysipelotrichia bacterium]